MIHTLPSTYILRDIIDIDVFEPVRWVPQTIGWQVVALFGLIFLLINLFITVRKFWSNRYRNEARQALQQLEIDDPRFEYRLFCLMKIVVTYIDPKSAKLDGECFLQRLDSLIGRKHAPPHQFQMEVGTRWLQALVTRQVVLSRDEKARLRAMCSHWLSYHTAPIAPPKVVSSC
ncbi:hypothetical protein BCU68_14510 [Vibrio sp. 10N.286.49.B3]|uniref:DUF4381 domain-containing protein n=1 Tax=Vibrio sp. 10N.286.49.B3 TaxID=1880855 RepID=UPI000C82F5F9|nr:DUF4381 domain-containing protein [Vibrio sp. 10N.286.49.B3]PMH42216.1 hypothetical protein BCU68_14510 [Vibrio sp. 10N.286.49.B3]